MTEAEPLKNIFLAHFEAENIMRIRVARIDFTGNVTLIGGENEQGKSSLLNSIAMLLGGKAEFDEEPLRKGARKGRIFGDFGEFKVERTLTAKGTTELTVTLADGEESASPQTVLNELISRYTFDPLGFFRLDPPKQDAFLRDACGLDFEELEAEEALIVDRRRLVNADVKRLKTLLAESPHHQGAPKAFIDVAETVALKESREQHNERRREYLRAIEADKSVLARSEYQLRQTEQQIEELERQLVAARSRWEAHNEDRETLAAKILVAEANTPAEEPTEELRAKLMSAEEVNAKVRANMARADIEKNLQKAEDAADEFQSDLEHIKDRKAERLAAMKFPVPGLSFTEHGWRFQDVPISQASQAQKLRLGVAFGCVLNPRIKLMLLREGSLLGDEMLKLLGELAVEYDCQVIVERVGTRDPGAIIISDGEVVGVSDGHVVAAE